MAEAHTAAEVRGWSRFFEELHGLISDSHRQIGVANEVYVEFIIDKLDTALRSIHSIQETLRDAEQELEQAEAEIATTYSRRIAELTTCIQTMLSYWHLYQDRLESSSTDETGYQIQVVHVQGRRGRPAFGIARNQLEYLHSLGFTWVEMATLLGVSRMTLYRRRREFGILTDSARRVSDQELTDHLQRLRTNSPYIGESMILGHLRAMNIQASRERVRHILRRIDPLNTALRWGSNLTSRRPYSVPGPNSLWHIDGHHKLVRWRFITHCDIDGYSRLVVYLRCSTNNLATTVYDSFVKATRRYGVPSRVRCDQGRENIRIGQFMLERRGPDRGSIITGSSVHNQRIERLWRDMHRCATQLFYRLFYFLEHNALLDPVNEQHLFALQFIFLPRINRALDTFRDGWNQHGIRTEGNHSPLQLFHSGTLRLQHSGLEAMDLFTTVGTDYGLDPEAPYPASDDSEGVAVPVTRVPISEEDYEQLQLLIDPLAESENYGIDLYQETLQFLNEHAET